MYYRNLCKTTPQTSGKYSGRRLVQLADLYNMEPSVGTPVRVWWPQDRLWHSGRVTQTAEESGEFLVEYDDEDDGDGWVSMSHQWESASTIVPRDAPAGGDGVERARLAAEVAAALSSRQAAEHQAAGRACTSAAQAEAAAAATGLDTAADGAQMAGASDTVAAEDLDPVADRAHIEERFRLLYDEATALHGDALADPEAGFRALLQSVEPPGVS